MKKYKKYLLIIIVFLLPWQARWLPGNFVYADIYNEYTLPSLFVIDVLMIFTVLWSWKDIPKINAKILLPILIWLTINAVFAVQPFFVIWKAFLLLVLASFIYVVRKNVEYSKLKTALILAGVAQAIIGLTQFFFQYIPASTWLGIAEQSASILGSSVIETANGRWLRAYGTFPHPNILGGFLSLILLVVIDYYQQIYIEFKKRFDSIDKKDLKKIGLQIVGLLSSFVVIFSGLIVSFSRSAWLAFVLGVVAYSISQIRQKHNILPLIKLSFVSFLVAATFFVLYSGLFTTRFTKETRLENLSVAERIIGYQSYLEIVKTNWLTGTGMGNYVFNLSSQNSGQLAYVYQPVHNTWLLIFAEIGIFGLALLVYLLKDKRFIWSSLSLSMVVAVIIIGLFDHYLWSIHTGVLIVLLYLLTINKS